MPSCRREQLRPATWFHSWLSAALRFMFPGPFGPSPHPSLCIVQHVTCEHQIVQLCMGPLLHAPTTSWSALLSLSMNHHCTSELQYKQEHRCCWVSAGVKQLLQYPGLPDGALHFAAVEGLSCQTGLLDGPASLLTSLLACGSTSDASLAAIQAGWLALCMLCSCPGMCCHLALTSVVAT